ncbi:MAG: hypothetical protein AAF125_01960 [Chloroflexota bacterium]
MDNDRRFTVTPENVNGKRRSYPILEINLSIFQDNLEKDWNVIETKQYKAIGTNVIYFILQDDKTRSLQGRLYEPNTLFISDYPLTLAAEFVLWFREKNFPNQSIYMFHGLAPETTLTISINSTIQEIESHFS